MGMGMGMGGGLMLLGVPEVQKELKMTPDQVSKLETKQPEARRAVNDLVQKAGGMEAMRNMKTEDREKLADQMRAVQSKAVAEILDADQQKRFRQLELQQTGLLAFFRKDVADELNLTREQSDKIRGIQRDQQREMRDVRQDADPRNMTREDRQKWQAKMTEMRKASLEKAVSSLTEEQQKQWKAMIGEPFKFPARTPGRRQGPVGNSV